MRAPAQTRSFRREGRLFFPDFRQRFAAVAGCAERLQIFGIAKQRPVSPMRADVVSCCGFDATPFLKTGRAPWLTEQLFRSKLLCPDRQKIPVVIRRRSPAHSGPGRTMRITPALSGQFRTSRMSARSWRLARHGLSPPRNPGKKKSQDRQHNAFAYVIGLGS